MLLAKMKAFPDGKIAHKVTLLTDQTLNRESVEQELDFAPFANYKGTIPQIITEMTVVYEKKSSRSNTAKAKLITGRDYVTIRAALISEEFFGVFELFVHFENALKDGGENRSVREIGKRL
jgi:hypothetical protein